MTNIATLAVAMVGSVLVVSWLTWRLVRGVPEGYDSETEVKTPLVTIRRKVQRSELHSHAEAHGSNRELDTENAKMLPATRTDLEATIIRTNENRSNADI
jgi:hypothetical protein